VIPLVIAVFDEGFDLVSKVRRLEVVLQQNAVLHLSVLWFGGLYIKMEEFLGLRSKAADSKYLTNGSLVSSAGLGPMFCLFSLTKKLKCPL